MILRLATFFKILPGALLLAAAVRTDAAMVTGQIELADSRDRAVRKERNFSGVAVWLQPANAVPGPLPHVRALMLQKDKKFTPHLLVISKGSTVDFPNLDPIFHSAFSNFEGQIFDIALYPPGSSRSVRFGRPGIVRVFCNIHPAMSAVIVVVDTRYFATTDETGKYCMPNVPAGEYKLNIFHERATPETLKHLVRSIVIGQQDTTLEQITVSETGYLPVAHKNKYDRPYSTPGDDERPY
jgi:plastocyanin